MSRWKQISVNGSTLKEVTKNNYISIQLENSFNLIPKSLFTPK